MTLSFLMLRLSANLRRNMHGLSSLPAELMLFYGNTQEIFAEVLEFIAEVRQIFAKVRQEITKQGLCFP